MAKTGFFINFLQKYYRLISTLISLVIFFIIYNVFLVNNTLEYMKFSFEQIGSAYDLDDLDGLDIIITEAMMEELQPQAHDSVTVSNMEYARSLIRNGRSYKQVENVKTSLGTAVYEMEKKRGIVLTILDGINRQVKKGAMYIAQLPYRVRLHKGAVKEEIKADTMLFKAAKEQELEANFDKALSLYEEFIKLYPGHEKTSIARLRAAYTYQKIGDFEKARAQYKDIVKDYPLQKEADIARIQLSKLTEIDKTKQEIDALIIKMEELPKDQAKAKQHIYYRIGVLQTKLFNLGEAKKFFRRSFESDPSGEMAIKSRFSAAWVDKENYKLDLSTTEFLEIAEETSGSSIAYDSRYVVANIYQQEGKYEDAIDMFLKLADENKNSELAGLYLFQAGASCLYDLNDQERADKIFKKIYEDYPDSPYSKYASTETPVGLFLTFVVPRATRAVTWRGAGLMCLSGYAGEIVKFKARAVQENYNKAFSDWLKVELPDTVGNIWVNITDTDFVFKKDKASAAGHLTMGKFEVDGDAAGYLKMTKRGSIRLVITKAILENIPIPPILVNMALSGLFLIVENYFPVTITDISMEDDAIYIDGFGGRRILERIAKSAKNLMSVEIATESMQDPKEKEELYSLYKEKFPWSNFSESADEEGTDSLFYDFFTRMSLYASFKLLETIKDTKLDYQRSLRTFGMLDVKKEKFKVTYTEENVNTSLNMYILKEFPWLVSGRDLFDVKGLEFRFTDNGDIELDGYLNMGRNIKLIKDAVDLRIRGKLKLAIDEESGIPYFIFQGLTLNRQPFPTDKLNELSKGCLDILKDGHIPFKLDEIQIAKGQIMLRGEGAEDFLDRVFSDPYLFVIFEIRDWDLYVAGIQRMRPTDYKLGDRWLKNLPDNEVKRILRERPGAELKEEIPL